MAVNFADTDWSVESARLQELPLHAPPYPPNVKPEPAVAVSVTVVPDAKDAEQVDGQSIPAGLLVTVPVPLTETVNFAFWGGGVLLLTLQADKNRDKERATIRANVREFKRGQLLSSRNLGAKPSSWVAIQLFADPEFRRFSQDLKQTVNLAIFD